MNTHDIQFLDFVVFHTPLDDFERLAIYLVVDKFTDFDRIDVMEIHQKLTFPGINRLPKADFKLYYRPTEEEKARILSGASPAEIAPMNEEEEAEGDLLLEELTGTPANYGDTRLAIETLERRVRTLSRRIKALPQDSPRRLQLEAELRRSESDLQHYHHQLKSRQ